MPRALSAAQRAQWLQARPAARAPPEPRRSRKRPGRTRRRGGRRRWHSRWWSRSRRGGGGAGLARPPRFSSCSIGLSSFSFVCSGTERDSKGIHIKVGLFYIYKHRQKTVCVGNCDVHWGVENLMIADIRKQALSFFVTKFRRICLLVGCVCNF